MIHAEPEDGEGRPLQQRLHDGLGQYLSLAVMQIDAAQAAPESEPLRYARALLIEALQELRSLIAEIGQQATSSPKQDLPAQLSAFVRCLNAQQTTPVRCTIEGVQRPVSDLACQILLDATRELLVNACKHGSAASVEARLSILPTRLSITVTEHWMAERPRPCQQEPAPGLGLGLCYLRQRLSLIGARLRWRNGGPGGVQARISWVSM